MCHFESTTRIGEENDDQINVVFLRVAEEEERAKGAGLDWTSSNQICIF